MALVLGLFALLVWRGLAIAAETREPFGRLVAAGLAALLAVEVLINTGMTVGLLPVTGLSLPLVSYGGSGLVAHALAIGLLLNIGLRPGYEVTNEPFRWLVQRRIRDWRPGCRTLPCTPANPYFLPHGLDRDGVAARVRRPRRAGRCA